MHVVYGRIYGTASPEMVGYVLGVTLGSSREKSQGFRPRVAITDYIISIATNYA